MMIGGSHAPTVKNEALSANKEAPKLRPFLVENQGVSARCCPFCKSRAAWIVDRFDSNRSTAAVSVDSLRLLAIMLPERYARRPSRLQTSARLLPFISNRLHLEGKNHDSDQEVGLDDTGTRSGDSRRGSLLHWGRATRRVPSTVVSDGRHPAGGGARYCEPFGGPVGLVPRWR